MKIGFALSSGYFGFFSHAGFFSAMEDSGINPNCVSGSSSGALVSALIMSGYNAKEILEILNSVKKSDFWSPDWKHVLKNIFLLKGFNGFLRGDKYRELLGKYVVNTFKEAKVKGVIMALDIDNRKQVAFSSGDLADATVASGIVPLMFLPYKIGDNYYIDGGMATKVPLLELYKKYKPDIIYVNLVESSILTKKDINLYNPFKLSTLHTAISRKNSYLIEKEFVESMGCKVVEFVPNSPRVSPNNMHLKGVEVFEHSKKFVLDKLS